MQADSTELWRARIEAREASGLSARAWCEQNGIKANLFYFWKHTLSRKDNGGSVSSWLPAVVCDEGAVDVQPSVGRLVVRAAGVEVEVHNGCDPTLLRTVLLALGVEQC